jgi:hypothetical protein
VTATWKTARTFADMCELMALWLEGRIPFRPGYLARYPEPETAPLISTLAAANRAGFLTDDSQPGGDGRDRAASTWRQRPAVTGFVSDRGFLKRLAYDARCAGLTVVTAGTATSTGRAPDRIAVTEVSGKPFTWYGARVGRADLLYLWQGLSLPGADALCGAEQVTIIDPAFGSGERLWRLLDRVSGRRR